MNHLRELLDSTVLEAPPSMTYTDVSSIVAEVGYMAKHATCFWLGEVRDTIGLKVIPELVRLPYDICWFELGCSTNGETASVGMLAMQSPKLTRIICFLRRKGAWRLNAVTNLDSFNSAQMAHVPTDENTAKKVEVFRLQVAAFLSALHCSNIRRQEHAPDAKLQRARSKRGKAPLFSYWTLQLDGKGARAEHQGGTHSSPRVHLRRGHPRQHAPGKWTWVQACAVGNRAAGMVHKDYTAGPALLVPAR